LHVKPWDFLATGAVVGSDLNAYFARGGTDRLDETLRSGIVRRKIPAAVGMIVYIQLGNGLLARRHPAYRKLVDMQFSWAAAGRTS
jgi:hypothetical protein